MLNRPDVGDILLGLTHPCSRAPKMKSMTLTLITLMTLGCASNAELEDLRAENEMLRGWLEEAIEAEEARVLTSNELPAIRLARRLEQLKGYVKTIENSLMRTEEHLGDRKKKNTYFSMLSDDQWERIRKIASE